MLPNGWFKGNRRNRGAAVRSTMAALVVSAVFAACGAGATPAAAADNIVIGTGSRGGVYIQLGKAICDVLKLRAYGITCKAVTSKGSIDNIKGLADGRFNIAIAQSDMHYHAVKGQALFKRSGPNHELRSLFSAHQESLSVIANPRSDVEDFGDLPGKRVNIGPDASGSSATMKILMITEGWKYSSFASVQKLSPTGQANVFCKDGLDVITFLAGHPNAVVDSVLRKCPSQLIDVVGPPVDRLLKRYPYYVPAIIPRTAYGGLRRDVRTIGLLATVLTTSRLSDATAFEVTRTVFENLNLIRRKNNAFRSLHPIEMANRGLTAPLHPGARRYLHESGRLR